MDLNEKIIECVRKHECLYEPSHKEYKNAVLKARIWSAIAGKLNESPDTIRKKWKTMRDGYMKYKKQVKGTTGSARKNITYIWAAQLSFLDKSIRPRETVSNIIMPTSLPSLSSQLPPSTSSLEPTSLPSLSSQLPTSTSSLEPTSLPSLSSQLPPSTSSLEPTSLPSLSSQLPPSTSSLQPTTPRRTTQKNTEPDLDRIILDFINSKKDAIPIHDSIDYLFLSYAQTFKKFSTRKQAMLKVDLAKLFCDAEISELAQEPSHYTIHIQDSPAYPIVSTNSDTMVCSENLPSNEEEDAHTESVLIQTINSEIPEDLSNNLSWMVTDC